MGLNTTQMLRAFLATQMPLGIKNVSTYLTSLKADPCCGMHVPASKRTWEENHKEDCREHPVLHILLTRDLDYLLWASLFSPAITREEKTVSEWREVGSRGSRATGTGLSRWWRLSPALSSVPSTLSLPPPAHASQPARPPQGSSFLITQCYDAGIFLMGSLFVEFFDYSDLREHRASVGVSWKSERDLRVSMCMKRRLKVETFQLKQSRKE